MDQKQAAIMAIIELETKLHFDRDHDGARTLTLTQPDCDSARAFVDAAGHLLLSIVHSTLLLRIEGVELWLAGRGTLE
ncbi:hypothetical protein PQR75_45195 [Paraburkholderia fungorum]|uniref:hypothetical protein n=1 Tax=Paraburkholderia fungorum TaxID=134537 RepID=UPI0038BB2EA3